MKFLAKNSRTISMLILMAFMAFPIYAAIATVESDSLGAIGNLITSQLEKYPILVPIAALLALAINGLLMQLINTLFNKLKFRYRYIDNKLVTSLLNRVLAKCFGKSSLYYNIEIDDKKLTPEQKIKAEELKLEMLKEHFRKHDPLIKIDLQKLMKN